MRKLRRDNFRIVVRSSGDRKFCSQLQKNLPRKSTATRCFGSYVFGDAAGSFGDD